MNMPQQKRNRERVGVPRQEEEEEEEDEGDATEGCNGKIAAKNAARGGKGREWGEKGWRVGV